jgi:site-specific recombinase XerD
MPTVKLFINKKYKKKDGKCAVYLLVHIDYKSLKFPTGVSVDPDPKKFNYATMRIRGGSKEVKDDNLTIEKSLALMNDIFVRYRLQNIHLTPELLKNEWKNPARRIDFYSFFDEALSERKPEIAKQTWKNHKSAIDKLKEFSPKLAFAEITPDFLESYRRWMKTQKKNDINTIYGSMKVLKTYLNIAIRKGIIITNPFNQVRVKEAKTDRLFLSIEELEVLWDAYRNPKNLNEFELRDLRHYLFMCFTGCRISDFQRLTTDNVNKKTLIYYPLKTVGVKSEAVKVPLNKYALQLIEDEKRHGILLFESISEQKLNVHMKEIAGKLGIFKPLTNHSARHTFATTWLSQTHDLAALQKLLGHSKISDTMKYVHITDEMLRDQMKAFEKSVFKKKKKKKNPDSSEPG